MFLIERWGKNKQINQENFLRQPLFLSGYIAQLDCFFSVSLSFHKRIFVPHDAACFWQNISIFRLYVTDIHKRRLLRKIEFPNRWRITWRLLCLSFHSVFALVWQRWRLIYWYGNLIDGIFWLSEKVFLLQSSDKSYKAASNTWYNLFIIRSFALLHSSCFNLYLCLRLLFLK